MKKQRIKSRKKQDLINLKKQKIIGKKEFNYLTIESESEIPDITLLEWDEKEYLYQLEHGMWLKNEYDRLHLNGTWFRGIARNFIGREILIYGIASGVANYVRDEVVEMLSKYLDKKVPCDYFREFGEELFKKIGKRSFTLDHNERRCGGKEDLRRRLDFVMLYLYDQIADDALYESAKLGGYTFKIPLKEKGSRYSESYHYLIGCKVAAEKIRLHSFFEDFARLEQPSGLVDQIVKKVYKKHKKILKNLIHSV